MKEEDYSTIEHDFLHAKDYLSNYKFAYKERNSKLDFLQNINNNSICDSSELINTSKQQLVEVKNVNKELDQELKNFSVELYNEEIQRKNDENLLSTLNEQESKLIKELEYYSTLTEKLEINNKLNNECDLLDNEINNLIIRMDHYKEEMSPAKIENKINEEKDLKLIRDDLAARQKRLTIINTDNYIEDSYYWYSEYKKLLENLLGNIEYSFIEDKIVIRLNKNENNYIEIFIKDKKIVDATISSNCSDYYRKIFETYKEYSLLINDMRLIACIFNSQ